MWYRSFIRYGLVIAAGVALSGCQNVSTDAVKPVKSVTPAEAAIAAADQAAQALAKLEQAEEIRYVLKSENNDAGISDGADFRTDADIKNGAGTANDTDTNTAADTDNGSGTFFYLGTIKNGMLEMKGIYQDREIILYKGPGIQLKSGNDYKNLDENRVGLISPLDHLDLVKRYLQNAVRDERSIFIDKIKYDQISVTLPSDEVMKKLQQFLGPQFSDKITLEQVAGQISVTYNLAVHPVDFTLKQLQVAISFQDDGQTQEQNIYFRFLDG